VRACGVCQQNKMEHLQPAGHLRPLKLPSAIWADVAMDFIEGIPRVNNKTVLLIVVDRFSKAAHFIPFNHPYTATTVARIFFDVVMCLHGIPSSIVSDHNPVFTTSFWHELFALSSVKLNLSSRSLMGKPRQ
jgi:hypothetical protein